MLKKITLAIGILLGLLLAVFAFDSKGLGFIMHMIPSLLVWGAAYAGWKWPGYGALAFTGLGVFSLFFFRLQLVTFIILPLPLFAVSALHLLQHSRINR